jgi:hypothetical protein
MSAEKFLPKIYKEIKEDVTIISARTKYEKIYP